LAILVVLVVVIVIPEPWINRRSHLSLRILGGVGFGPDNQEPGKPHRGLIRDSKERGIVRVCLGDGSPRSRPDLPPTLRIRGLVRGRAGWSGDSAHESTAGPMRRVAA